MTFNTSSINIIIATTFVSFKPYYKWMTFNTEKQEEFNDFDYSIVLNLIINGWPSILKTPNCFFTSVCIAFVLNLIINGWPSIPLPKGWMSYLC